MIIEEIIAELHLHSKYARAVSPEMIPGNIALWASKKGIGLVGTGDFTHALWLAELEAGLEEAGEGVYKLREGGGGENQPLFMLTTEAACIYSDKGRGRRIHLLIWMPNFGSVRRFNQELGRRGVNLMSDGRPIMGLSVAQVTEIALSIESAAMVIPAHVWTPWFGLYGANGGYDSLEEAFGNFSKYISAVETGLSSDPAMNWGMAELDNRQIVSFGDAHSPAKLGREATVFRIKNAKCKRQNYNSKLKIEYKDVYDAMTGNPEGKWEIGGTIEFYPEEGKYHFTGHRNCKVCYSPEETGKMGTTCPVCGRKLTVGVADRVATLAARDVKVGVNVRGGGVREIRDEKKTERPGYVMLVPLMEILAESLGVGVASQKVLDVYENLCAKFEGEFEVLLKTPVEEITRLAGERVAEGVERVRKGEIVIKPGYDGVFGQVRIWGGEVKDESGVRQSSLFDS